MAIFRIKKKKNYTSISNSVLQNKQISHQARGLLVYMLSLPDDWDYTLTGLVTNSKEGIKAIRNTLNELKKEGYVEINKYHTKNGTYQYEYIIREEPKET